MLCTEWWWLLLPQPCSCWVVSLSAADEGSGSCLLLIGIETQLGERMDPGWGEAESACTTEGMGWGRWGGVAASGSLGKHMLF